MLQANKLSAAIGVKSDKNCSARAETRETLLGYSCADWRFTALDCGCS
jgi:hypothetical protein